MEGTEAFFTTLAERLQYSLAMLTNSLEVYRIDHSVREDVAKALAPGKAEKVCRTASSHLAFLGSPPPSLLTGPTHLALSPLLPRHLTWPTRHPPPPLLALHSPYRPAHPPLDHPLLLAFHNPRFGVLDSHLLTSVQQPRLLARIYQFR